MNATELQSWTQVLTHIAAEPLEFCPDFPQIAKRFEAWWAHECIDRPILIAASHPKPSRRLELLFQPDAWLAAKIDDVRQTYRVGDALPSVRSDFGPVLLGGLVGGKIEFGADTTWTHAFIDDEWSNAPSWTFAEDHPLWVQLQKLTRMAVAAGEGRYLVTTPDLGGSADVLLNLRGPTGLCMDVLERPDQVRTAIEAIFPAWERAFTELYRLTVGQGVGIMHFLLIWSNRPYMIPACDFNYMIGPEEFESICLPDIAHQAGTVGRAVFHLDGPGAARHIDSLLQLKELDAIQFTPGEGTPSALAWVEMFRKIQAAGKSVFVFCPADEVLTLRRALKPEGLAICTGGLPPAGLDQLYREFCRQ